MGEHIINLTGGDVRWPDAHRRDWVRCIREAAPDFDRSPVAHPLGDVLGGLLGLPSSPFITSGVRSAIPALASLGRRVVVERPTFAEVPRLFIRHGCPVTMVPLRDAIGAAGDPVTALIWLTSPARNPDGGTLEPDVGDALAQFARAGGLVIQNESYRWFTTTQPARVPGAVLIGSLHKLAGSWTRLGWLAGDLPDNLQHDLPYQGPPAFWQSAWQRFLTRDGLAPLVELATAASDRAARAWHYLRGDQVASEPPQAPTMLLRIAAVSPVTTLRERFGVLANPGTAFGAGPDMVRLSFVGCDADRLEWDRFSRIAAEGHVSPVDPRENDRSARP